MNGVKIRRETLKTKIRNDLRTGYNYFFNRITPTRNALPKRIVQAPTLNMFKDTYYYNLNDIKSAFNIKLFHDKVKIEKKNCNFLFCLTLNLVLNSIKFFLNFSIQKEKTISFEIIDFILILTLGHLTFLFLNLKVETF